LPVAEKPETLVDAIGEFYADPLGYVLFAFNWGEGDLKNEPGPDPWQEELLLAITDKLTVTLSTPGKQLSVNDVIEEAIQLAVRSGHTIGKTTLIAWLILWFMSTRPHPQIVVTSNTETQLNTKTWRELSKWHQRSINKDWFQWTATKFYHVAHPETWFASAIPWSANKPEAFAGTHERYVLMIFDEASAIPDIIWETAEGSMNTPGAMWVVFGNPTQNSGRFFECFGKFKHRWLTREVDSRQSRRADQKKIAEWIADYGEDSDFVRVRVRGLPPRAGNNQFIASDIVETCKRYKAEGYQVQAVILGVDVARYGDDSSVILRRQGRMVWPLKKYRGLDTMQLADKVIEEKNDLQKDGIDVDYVMVDGVGVGAGVVDRLKQLGQEDIIEVNAGTKARDDKEFANLRAEMWGTMRDALKAGLQLPDDRELHEELCQPEYYFTNKQQLMLEKKEDMKARGLSSPDCADSLALTFSQGITLPRKQKNVDSGRSRGARPRFM